MSDELAGKKSNLKGIVYDTKPHLQTPFLTFGEVLNAQNEDSVRFQKNLGKPNLIQKHILKAVFPLPPPYLKKIKADMKHEQDVMFP